MFRFGTTYGTDRQTDRQTDRENRVDTTSVGLAHARPNNLLKMSYMVLILSVVIVFVAEYARLLKLIARGGLQL